jgi:hypothetical protein
MGVSVACGVEEEAGEAVSGRVVVVAVGCAGWQAETRRKMIITLMKKEYLDFIWEASFGAAVRVHIFDYLAYCTVICDECGRPSRRAGRAKKEERLKRRGTTRRGVKCQVSRVVGQGLRDKGQGGKGGRRRLEVARTLRSPPAGAAVAGGFCVTVGAVSSAE